MTKMTNMWKKFWHWMRCEDEDGNPIDKPWQPFRYSEMIKHYPIHGTIDNDDILMKHAISQSSNLEMQQSTCDFEAGNHYKATIFCNFSFKSSFRNDCKL